MKTKLLSISALLFILIIPSPINAQTPFSPGASHGLCFTPGQECTNLIIETLKKAKSRILVQAYSFTSAPNSRGNVLAI